MFAKLVIPLLALAVTLGLASMPAEARGGGAHGGHAGGHGYHGHVSGHGYHGGYHGGHGGFYAPFWCPYAPYYGCLGY
jgi:hypothetical protein